MASHSLIQAYRMAPRVGGQFLRTCSLTRGFMVSSFNAAAHNMKMPAMSPTMTEGNIGAWKVKEGEKFSAGDVIMEIETDKAQIDVEAPDDGIMFKILVQSGTKNVPVGARIAVFADPRDDLSRLEIPPEDVEPKEPQANIDSTSSSLPPSSDASAQVDKSYSTIVPDSPRHRSPKNPHTPSPSILALLHQHKLSKDDIPKIPATGPKGRLLKGDLLAYVGAISKSHVTELESSIQKLSKLDLSNIKVTPIPTEVSKKTMVKKPTPPPEIDVSVEVSLHCLKNFLGQTSKSLGFHPSLSTLLSVASQRASRNLPKSKLPPSQTDLFNELIGISSMPAKINYTPKLVPIPSKSPAAHVKQSVDIIDILASNKLPLSSIRKVHTESLPCEQAKHTLTLKIKREDEKRGLVFLSRVKELLESNPQELMAGWSEVVKT